MLHLLSAHRHLPSKTKALGCWSFALTALLVAGVYLLTWQTYRAQEPASWVGLGATVNSNGSSWKPDRSLTQFGVRFTLPGDSASQVRPVYANTQAFHAAGLRKGTPVRLVVEPHADPVIIRELATLEGQVLYDDGLYQRVIQANNDSIRLIVIALPILALAGLAAGVYFGTRRARPVR